MHTYTVYARVYDTASDYRARRYHYMVVTVTAKDTIEAEIKAARNYFSFSLVSIAEKGGTSNA